MDGLIRITRLGPDDVSPMRALNALFADAFEDPDSYAGAPPDDAYLQDLLAKPHVIALVARDGVEVAGGLVAYELDKFEQARREIYIFDLGVGQAHRRRGVATDLIRWLQDHAAKRNASVVYVQADPEDAPAVALYERLGARAEVLHFDIPVGER